MSQLRQQKETEKALAEESAKKRELEAKRMVRLLDAVRKLASEFCFPDASVVEAMWS